MMDALKRRLKRFVDDERAVSPVVGFVLMFALIMILFTIYNADVVPAQNQDVEYEHTQTIEGQMEQLSAAFLSADENGSTKSVALQLGVQYPTRVFGINPGTPVGTLNTTGPYDVRISGGGGSMDLNTSFVNYLPNYNLMQQETQYSIEHGLLVKDYDGSDNTRLKATGALFSSDNESINLRLISSNLQESRMSTVVTADNVDTHETTVTSNNTTLSLPTTLQRSKWDQLAAGSGQATIADYTNNSSGVNRVDIALENGTTINMNRVTAGNPPPDDDIGIPPYLKNETPTSIDNATPNGTTNHTVRVVDVFGSKYDDEVEIDATTSGEGNLTPTTKSSNDSDMATFSYNSDPDDAGDTVEVTASLSNRTKENASVTFEIEYSELETGDDDPSNGGPSDGGADTSIPRGSSSTNPKFHVSYSDPIEVSQFSLTATDSGNVSDLERTNNPHVNRFGMKLSTTEANDALQRIESERVELNGTVYDFDNSYVVSDSNVHIMKFDSGNGLNLLDSADSRSEADFVVTFYGPDGNVADELYFKASQ